MIRVAHGLGLVSFNRQAAPLIPPITFKFIVVFAFVLEMVWPTCWCPPKITAFAFAQ